MKGLYDPEFEPILEEIVDYQWDIAILSVRLLWRAHTQGQFPYWEKGDFPTVYYQAGSQRLNVDYVRTTLTTFYHILHFYSATGDVVKFFISYTIESYKAARFPPINVYIYAYTCNINKTGSLSLCRTACILGW